MPVVERQRAAVSAGRPGCSRSAEVDRTEPAVQRPALVLGVLSASILLDALDLSITQVALPSIQRKLALPAAMLQWVATGYALTYGGFLLLGGRAADLQGRRRLFLIMTPIVALVLLAANWSGVVQSVIRRQGPSPSRKEPPWRTCR